MFYAADEGEQELLSSAGHQWERHQPNTESGIWYRDI